MPKSQDKTTAENLEEWSAGEPRHGRLRREGSGRGLREAAEIQKFDGGEDVLDYFDVRTAQVINSKTKRSTNAAKFSYTTKQSAAQRALVREKAARYRKKTG